MLCNSPFIAGREFNARTLERYNAGTLERWNDSTLLRGFISEETLNRLGFVFKPYGLKDECLYESANGTFAVGGKAIEYRGQSLILQSSIPTVHSSSFL